MFFANKGRIIDCLIFFSVPIFFIFRIYFSSGELTPDSIQYLLQAQNFWEYKVNFPLGYPLMIKMFSFFTGSFFTASKLINILSYISIILFSYKKKFIFPETVLIFSFYPFLNFYAYTLSEPLYYFINYLIIYYSFLLTKEGFNNKSAIFLCFLFFILVSIRFSGIFVLLASLGFFVFLRVSKKIPQTHFFILSAWATLGVLCYLFINFLYCGLPLGQRDHLSINHTSPYTFITKTSHSVVYDFSFLNGIIHKGILGGTSFLNSSIGAILLLAAIIILYKNRKRTDFFNIYLIFSFIIILISTLYSYYTTKIDDTIRIKSNAYFYLLIFLSLNISKKIVNYLKVYALLIIYINSFTLIKYSSTIINYFSKFDLLECQSNHINIIYNSSISNEKNYAPILLFKAYLIDKNYKFSETDQSSDEKNYECQIKSPQIIE